MKKRILCTVLVFLLLFPSYGFAADTDAIEMTEGGIMLEAEDLKWGNSFAVMDDPNASGGKAVVNSSDSSAALVEADTRVLDPTISLKLNVKKTDNYAVYFRLRTLNGDYTTCWMSVDGRTVSWRNPPATTEYSWSSIISYRLTEGIHEIQYYYRHTMVIDKIIITNNAVEPPSGMGEMPGVFSINQVDNGIGNDLIYPLPPVVPSTERPRLFVTKEQIPTVKANLEHPQNKPIYQKLLAEAAQDYDCKLDEANLADNSNMAYLGYIEANAFLYLINRDPNAGKKAVDGILNYMSTLNVDVGGAADRNGLFSVYIAGLVYDWCYELLTDTEKSTIINAALLNAGKGEMHWPPIGENAFNSNHGDEYGLLKDLFAFSIAVYGDYNEAYQLCAGRLFSEYLPSRNEKYKDSIYNTQGDNYGLFRSGADWYFKLILKGLGCDNMLVENQHFQAYQQIYRRLPNNSFMRDGDIYDPVTSYQSYPTALFIGSVLYQDPYLKQEFFRANLTAGSVRTSDAHITKSLYLLLNDVSLEGLPKEQLPLSIYSGDTSGIMTARTSWEEGIDSNAFVASMKVPENFYEGHSHRDAGHFYLYYKGPLAIDSGIYESTPFVDQAGKVVTTDLTAFSVHNKNYARQTIAHNSMLIYDPSEVTYYMNNINPIVNSGGQHAMQTVASDLKSYQNDLKINEVLGKDFGKDLNKPDYTYLSGDITGAYGKKVKEYTRSFMFFNFFDEVYPGALVVFDRVNASSASYKKTWLLHSVEEPEISGSRTTIRNTQGGYNGRLINDTLLPRQEDLQIAKIGGNGKEFLIDDWNWASYNKVKYRDETGKWRVEISPKESAEQNYFLNVLQVADNTVNPEPLESEYLESDLFYGVKIKDRAAFFGKSSKRVSKTFTLSISGGAEEQVTAAVADLEEGVWDVIKDGKTVATEYVSSEGSVLSFTGACGDYTIRKSRTYLEPVKKSFRITDHLDTSVPPYTQVSYNGLYDSSIPVIEKIYPGLSDMALHADNQAVITEEDSRQLITLYDDDLRREVVFTDGSMEATVTCKGETAKVTLKKPIRKIDGKRYIYYEDLKDTLDISAVYEPVGDILFATSTFTRVDNTAYIVNSDDPSRAKIKDLRASGFLTESPPYQASDGNIASQFAVNGKDTKLEIELEEATDLSGISICWAQQNKRTESFAIDVSEDGENFTEVWKGSSKIIDGDGYAFEDFNFQAKKIRFVRLRMFGNTNNDWNTINELYLRK